MNEVSEQILNAIDIIAQQRMSELQFDKTIQAKIYRVQNIDTGEYKVRYNGNIFSAYCDDPKKTYKVDELVYVNVPEGNFGNRKLIVSSVSASSLSYAQLTQLQNTIVSVSPSLTIMYPGVKAAPYKVIAGAAPNDTYYQDWIYQGPDTYSASDFHGLFQQYASQYQTLRIQASFLTQFHCLHNQGNYGIEVVFYTNDGKTASYKLDLNAFNGDPYSFSVYAPQSVILKIPKNYLLGLKSIRLFQEGFVPDRFIENGVITDNENLTVPNIFAQDLTIDFVEVQDLTDTAYYLTIDAPQGTILSATTATIDLVGRLIYQGENILTPSNCQCAWYERDPSIMVGMEGYDKVVGVGWKPVVKRVNGEDVPQTSYLLSLDTNDVTLAQEYTLKVIYNKDTTLIASIIVSVDGLGLKPGIEQKTEDNEVILQLVDTVDPSQNYYYTGNWYIQYPNGAYIPVPDGVNKSQISVSEYMTYDSITFYCAVYFIGMVYCGTLSYQLRNSSSEDDVVVSYLGEDMFRYDANGDITVEDAERDRTLQATLNWKTGQAASYTASWTFRESNGTEVEIPTSAPYYDPPNSMMEGLWVDNLNILHYNIKQKYKVNYNNNVLILKITTLFGDVFRFEKEILFLKDGDQGTNGTSYVIAIRPCDENGLKLNTFVPLVIENGVCTNTIPLRCYVYNDGELINGVSDYKIAYTWQGIGVYVNGLERITLDDGTDTVQVTGRLPQDYYNYVKVEVRIQDKSGKILYLHSNFTIDTSVDFQYAKADISEIPSYIKYTAAGISPSFSSKNLSYLYDNVLHNELIVSESSVLEIKVDRDNNYSLKPPVQFVFDGKTLSDNLGLLSFVAPQDADDSGILYHPVLLFLDTFGNEQINNWDGTKLEIGTDDDGNEISLFAPQIGAGRKESDNSFTGVVMGKDSAQDKIGLYGYQSGINTFGLMEDGRAYFGALKGGGRITIDGKTAEISGGGGGDSEIGMTITLADLNPQNSTDAIKIGGGAFNVTYDGVLTASKGLIGAKKTSTGRYTGGWTLDENQLKGGGGYGGNTIVLNSDPDNEYAIWAGRENPENAPFWVKKDGSININVSGISDDIKEYVNTQFSVLEGEVNSQITSNTLNMQSLIQQKLNEIKLEVVNGVGGASITLTAGDNTTGGRVDITGNVDISGQLSADALYSRYGDIADLTVSELNTNRKILKYLHNDTSPDNYLRVYESKIEFINASPDTNQTVQVTNPLGELLYWEESVEGKVDMSNPNAWPTKNGLTNGQRIFTTTTPTAYPVMRYVYEEGIRRSISYLKDPDDPNLYTYPVDVYGAGTSEAGQYGFRNGQGRIAKTPTEFQLIYKSEFGKESGLICRNSGYLDLFGMRRPINLDFSHWDDGTFTEIVDYTDKAPGYEDLKDYTYTYSVNFDTQGRPVSIDDAKGKHKCVIKW